MTELPQNIPSAGGTRSRAVLDNIGIVPAQLYGAPPRDFLREDIDTGLSIGKKTVERPVKLDYPIIIGGVRDTIFKLDQRQALIYGSGFARTLVDMGWLGILEEEREFAVSIGAKTMMQLTTARIGADANSIRDCDALSLSLLHSGSGCASGDTGVKASAFLSYSSSRPDRFANCLRTISARHSCRLRMICSGGSTN